MPLIAYPRGKTWWAKGRIEWNDAPITGYLRESTGASSQSGANAWIAQRTEEEQRRHLVGDAPKRLTFAEAVTLYDAPPLMARYLKPILAQIGTVPVEDITAQQVRDLGPLLYPDNATDTWRRWVITPTRAVINHAHDVRRTPLIRIAGYSTEQRIAQDRRRGKKSRIERTPGDWPWLLRFHAAAPPRIAALALTMFVTGARVGQAIAMDPDCHFDLQARRICIPGAKGHDDRWLTVPMELIVSLSNLPRMTPRGWPQEPGYFRVFGYADSCSPLKAWRTTCKRAGIPYLPPHSAGRHGFGQEYNVRQEVDEKAAGTYGGWSDTGLMRRTYTHAEDHEAKIAAAFRTGLVQAERDTGIKLLK